MFDSLRVGRSIRAIRFRLGLRQADVAARSKVSRALISTIERGLSRSTDVDKIGAVCLALGADLDVRVRWRGEGLDRLLDEGHASLVDALVVMLTSLDWEVAVEVTFNDYGERGSIDILAWHASSRSLLVVEVKTVIPDAQATLAPLDRKTRLAAKIGSSRGWVPATVSRVLVVREGPTNRRRVQRFADLFAIALPARNHAVRRWLAAPAGRLDGLFFLSDVASASTRRATAGRYRVPAPARRGFFSFAAPPRRLSTNPGAGPLAGLVARIYGSWH